MKRTAFRGISSPSIGRSFFGQGRVTSGSASVVTMRARASSALTCASMPTFVTCSKFEVCGERAEGADQLKYLDRLPLCFVIAALTELRGAHACNLSLHPVGSRHTARLMRSHWSPTNDDLCL